MKAFLMGQWGGRRWKTISSILFWRGVKRERCSVLIFISLIHHTTVSKAQPCAKIRSWGIQLDMCNRHLRGRQVEVWIMELFLSGSLENLEDFRGCAGEILGTLRPFWNGSKRPRKSGGLMPWILKTVKQVNTEYWPYDVAVDKTRSYPRNPYLEKLKHMQLIIHSKYLKLVGLGGGRSG